MKLAKLIRSFFLLSLIMILLFNFNLSTYAFIERNPKNTSQEKNYMSHEILVKFKSCVNENDENPHYPSGYDLSNIVSVAATNHKDELASYSNFGPQTVDIAAPGGEIPSIYSTIPPKRDILFYDDFESGKSNWATSGKYESWSIGTDSVENSQCIIDSISNYKEDEESYLQTSSPIIIKNCKGLHLEFRIIYELEYGNDYLFLDGSFDGQNFFNICYFTGSAGYDTKKYYTWTNDRNKEELHLKFLLKTDSSINKDGVYIDDIKLTGIPWEFTGNEYDYKMGTSMAAPIVSGIAGLIWSYKPHLSHLEVKNALLNSVEKLSSLRGKILTEGRVNAFNALVYEQVQEIKEGEEGSGCFINSISF